MFQAIKNDEDFAFPEDMEIDGHLCESDAKEVADGINQDTNHGAEIYSQKKSHKYSGMFLLASEAEDHLKSNRHHYSDEAVTYCSHAWRAPKTKRLFQLLYD